MDTISAAQAAQRLGTTIPRVVRGIDRLEIRGARTATGRYALTPEMVNRLETELGTVSSLPGRTRTELKVLAALRAAPFGLISARAVARRAGVSPTTAGKVVRSLEGAGLVVRRHSAIAAGRVIHADVIHANRQSPQWREIAPALEQVSPPRRSRRADKVVPPRLRHLFWNTAASQLRLESSGPYIARRLLTRMDLEGLAWGAKNLRPDDWDQAARGRGFDEATRALARNLAGQR